jgi:PKD domain-containing protein
LKPYGRLKVAAVPGVLALALIGAGCGGHNSKPSGGTLELSVGADRFAGPTPLNVKFSAKPKNAHGEVHYRWRFDDGTESESQSPAHSFPRAGYYTVIVDVRDERGNNTRQSLLLGAWPPRQWAVAQTKAVTPQGAKQTEKVQQHRTDVRHAQLLGELRRRIDQGS